MSRKIPLVASNTPRAQLPAFLGLGEVDTALPAAAVLAVLGLTANKGIVLALIQGGLCV